LSVSLVEMRWSERVCGAVWGKVDKVDRIQSPTCDSKASLAVYLHIHSRSCGNPWISRQILLLTMEAQAHTCV